MIIEKVKNFIEKYNLTGTFIVAFSGGYDSMCLLDILNKLNRDIIAIHLNHNWRGNESLKEAEICEKFAILKNIKFYTETLPDNIEKTETAAREARYAFFNRCAEKFNSNVVFTAHNFDDNAETILYRIIKGTGPCGLEGIAEHRDIFYRPLLSVKREDIELYCKEHNLTPNNDSSNNDIKYKRNLIRKKIIPLMKEINPKVSEAVNSLSEIIKEDNQDKFEIRDLLRNYNIDYDRKKIEDIYRFIQENKTSKSGKTLSLTTDLWLFVNNNTTEIITKNEKSDKELKIQSCGEYIFENHIFKIEPYNEAIKEFPKDKDLKAYISTNDINFTLRYRQNGDIIKPLGGKGSQKLKKYFNEKKIPNHKKDQIILLCKNNEVLWVSGYGLSDNIKVKNLPTHILTLRRRDGHK